MAKVVTESVEQHFKQIAESLDYDVDAFVAGARVGYKLALENKGAEVSMPRNASEAPPPSKEAVNESHSGDPLSELAMNIVKTPMDLKRKPITLSETKSKAFPAPVDKYGIPNM